MAPYITAVDYLGPSLASRSSTTCTRPRRTTGSGSGWACPSPTRWSAASPRSGRAPTGTSATAGTCTASASTATPTCAGSTCTRSSSATRCARTTRCAAASRSSRSGRSDEPFRGPGPSGSYGAGTMSKATETAPMHPRPAAASPLDAPLPDEADARQPRPLPPGHARHGPRGGRARRRDRPLDEAGHRLPAPGLREELRERHLDAGLPVHRSAQLRLVDHEQRRLRAGGREAGRPRGPGAGPVPARHHLRAPPHLRPPHAGRRHRARAGRHDRASSTAWRPAT